MALVPSISEIIQSQVFGTLPKRHFSKGAWGSKHLFRRDLVVDVVGFIVIATAF